MILAGEFAIGFVLGFTLQLFFDAALAGRAGLRRADGYSLATVLNPDSPADSTGALDLLSTLRSSPLHSVERAALAASRAGPQF